MENDPEPEKNYDWMTTEEMMKKEHQICNHLLTTEEMYKEMVKKTMQTKISLSTEKSERTKRGFIHNYNFNFRNNETGEEFEEFFTISGREEFLKDNPHITQTPSMFGMAGGTGDRIKNDSGWKENLSRIAEAHPRSNLQTDMVRSL